MICAIIGRETNLAYAEIESAIGDFEKVNSECVVFEYEKDTLIDIGKFGTVIKLAKVIDKVDSTAELGSTITAALLKISKDRDVGNLDFGISIYGKNLNYKTYKKLLIGTKKALAQSNIKTRFVESSSNVLNAAQIKYNNLSTTGVELIIAFSKDDIIIGMTYGVQDIDSYSKRDYGRPCRDMKVGMFPPKLAQSMINIAQVQPGSIVYDPFCGSGIVLQESALLGIEAWGSDLSESMVKCSKSNIKWLQDNYSIARPCKIFSADATKLTHWPDSKYHIVTEGFLGSPLHKIPTASELDRFSSELSPIYLDFVKNLKASSRAPESIVLTLPCWKQNSGLECLNIIDQIEELGYTIKQFQSVQYDKVIYKRDNQIVGRQILALKSKI